MAHEPHHREYVCELGVTRAGDFTDVDLDVPIGKRRCHALRDRQCAIVGARHAENELTPRIVLQGKRTQVFLETEFVAMQGHEQTNRGQVFDDFQSGSRRPKRATQTMATVA